MPGIIVRGRIAWILSIVLGAILIAVGIATSISSLVVGGAGFAVFGIVFLIISLATRGRSD